MGDNRRRDADADPGEDQSRFAEHRNHFGNADRHRDDQRDEHRRAQEVDPARAAGARNRVAEHNVNSEQDRAGEPVRPGDRSPAGADRSLLLGSETAFAVQENRSPIRNMAAQAGQ